MSRNRPFRRWDRAGIADLDPTLAASLDGALRRLRWLRFARGAAWLVIVLAVGVAALGLALHRGWRPDVAPLVVGLSLALVLAGLGGVVIAGLAISLHRRESWIAAEVEEANGLLLDRLNTAVALADGDVATEPALRRRIENQARGEMAWLAPPFDDEVRGTRQAWGFAILAVVATVALFIHWNPFAALGRSVVDDVAPETSVESPETELAAPDVDTSELAEPERAWGEVRITDPGEDLKVTKVDVVPLEIEAAASVPIVGARWVLQATGGEPRVHDLGAPEDPRYAIYRPTIYVDELRLSDWDVVSYHAGANAAEEHYRSEIYFLEVRPFREDIEKSSGGEGSPGYKALSELSALIDRQKRILRQTHRFLARPPLRRLTQDQRKLVEAEADLRVAVDHAYAHISATLEHAPIADVLDNLAEAEEHLEVAVETLENDPDAAPGPEQLALAALVETRKSLQRTMSENPDAFEGQPEEPPPPVAELGERLRQISEYRDAESAARDALESLQAEQREIRDQAEQALASGDAEERERAADRQRQAMSELDRWGQEHPELAQELGTKLGQAEDALRDAARGLFEDDSAQQVGAQQDQAVESLEALGQGAEQEATERRLGDAYKLDQMLADRQRELEEMADDPGTVDREQAASTADQTERLLEALERTAQGGLGGEGESPLEEALEGSVGESLGQALDRLARAGEASGRGEAAGQAAEGLGEVRDAFEQSLPDGVRQMRSRDALGEAPGEALGTALRQLRRLSELESLPEGEAGERAMGEALARLRRALDEGPDSDPSLRALVAEVEEELREVEPLEVSAVLQRLLAAIEERREERAAAMLDLPEATDLTHIDLSELPAEYRRRIEE